MSCKLTININRRPRRNQPKEKLFCLEQDLIVDEGKTGTLDMAIRKVQSHYGRYIKRSELWAVQSNDEVHQAFRVNIKGEQTYATIIIDVI